MKRIVCLKLFFALTVFAAFAGGRIDTVTGASSVFDYSLDGASSANAAGVLGGVVVSGNSLAGDVNITATSSESGMNNIVIYTSMYEDIIETVKTQLQRQFPQYNFVFVYGESGAIQARIEGERGAGTLGCDILMVADPSYSIELKLNGMLHRFTPRETGSLAFASDPEGYWHPVRINNMVLAFNPARYERNTVPNSFYGFANDERVRGAVSMTSPITSGTATAAVAALLEKYGYAYYASLRNQNVSVDNSYAALDKLESGEYKVIMVLEEMVLRRRQQQDSKIEIIYPTDGVVIIPSNIMVVNDRWSANKNAAAAVEIANWFLSAEGQSVIVSGWMHSVRTNFSRLPQGARPINEIRANSIRVNWDFVFRQRDMIRIRFQERVLGAT
jgi:iron(III) transport system substrate-binding protein